MADLELLNKEEGAVKPLTLESLNEVDEETRKQTRVPHTPSNMQRAARSALLARDPSKVVDNYRLILSELNEGGSSLTEDSLLKARKDEYKDRVNQTTFDYLSDPRVSDEEKRSYIDNMYEGLREGFNSYDTLLSDNIIDPSSERTEEAQNVRVGLSNMINSINRQKREEQQLANALASQWTGGTSDTFAEFLELSIPYTEWNHVRRIREDFLQGEGDDVGFMDTFLIGSRKMDIINHLKSLPEDKRNQAITKLLEIVQNNDQVLLQDDNDFASYQAIQDYLSGEYSTFDKVVDNVTGLLDVIGIGGMLRRPMEILGESFAALKAERVRTGTQPGSAAEAAQATNVDKAEAIHESIAIENKSFIEGEYEVIEAEAQELSQSLYGTNREDAIASDYAPSQTAPDGSIKKRVHNIGRQTDARITPNAEVMDYVDRGGDIHFFKVEKEEMRSHVVNKFSDALGLRNRNEMLSVAPTDTGVKLSARYAPAESGFLNPNEAIEHTAFTLRSFGVTSENMTLMKLDGSKYVPLEGDELKTVLRDNVEGDYIVQVDYEYKFNPLDIANWMETDVTYNIFDRINVPFFRGSQGKGSVQRNILDPASMLNPNIVRGGSVAVERTAGLEKEMLDLGKQFTDVYVKLPLERQEVVYDYIKEMNFKGISPNYTKMVADGFSQKEIGALNKWKEYWDTHYTLENRDLATSLRNQGYEILEDIETDTRLIGKKTSSNVFKGSVRAYDPVEGVVKRLDKEQLKVLEESGGGIYTLRRPSSFGEEDVVEYVVSANRAGSSYFRAINPDDTILNYRKGYYHVSYNAPWFIDEVVKDASGKELYRKAVSVAGSIKEAELQRKRLSTSSGKEYVFRENKKDGVGVDDDDYWDLVTSGGRSSQRTRGKRLEGADAPLNSIGDNSYMLSPVDSLIETAKNISRRTSMRGYLDTVKKRFVEQYGHYIQRSPLDKPYGSPPFPESSAQLVNKSGSQAEKGLADARTTWEFITSLEHGYRNSIDDGSKALFKGVAEILGPKSEIAEKSFRWIGERGDVSRRMKGTAFELYLAANPLRQAVVQSHQATLLAANFGKYGSDSLVALPKNMAQLAGDTLAMTLLQMNPSMVKQAAKISGRSEKEIKVIFKDLRESGITAGVSKNSLINDSLAALADEAAYNKNKSYLSQIRLFSQKAGFESGERINITSAWLAYRDRALREGKEITPEVRDEITASARNYTYNMNAAGEMPYNKNSLAVIFQFMQVPHKAMLQLTNRQLSVAERSRLLVYQGLVYGLPAGFVYDTFSETLPDDPELRDNLVQGLEGVLLNTTLSAFSDDEVEIDWKSLAPIDMYGTYAFLEALMRGDVAKMVAESPSGQLFIGYNPRITNFVRTVGRYFNFIDDFEDPTELDMVLQEAAGLTSGFSNLYKANMALAFGHKVNSVGNVSDRKIATAEGVAIAFGFRTTDEAKKQFITETGYKFSQEWKEDLDQFYMELKRHLSKKGLTPMQLDYESKVLSSMWAAYGVDNTEEREYLVNKMKKDALKNLDGSMFKDILRIGGMDKGYSDAKAMVNALPKEYEHQRETLNEALDFIEEQRQLLRKGAE